MAKKLKIGGSYFNPETGMIESASGTGLGNSVSSFITKFRNFIKNLFPRRGRTYYYQASYFDRFRDWLLNLLDNFTENILPILMWIILLITIVLTWISDGFFSAAIVAVVGFLLISLVIIAISLILNLISFFIGKILYSKTTLIISVLLLVGVYFWQTEKGTYFWNQIGFSTNASNDNLAEYIVYSDVANIRTTPSSDSDYNIHTGVPFGYKVPQLKRYNDEWYKFRYNNTDRYIHSSVVMPVEDYILLKGILNTDRNVKNVDLAKYRKALLEYFKANRYQTGSTYPPLAWSIAQCVSGANIYKQEVNIQNNKLDVFGIIIENISSSRRKLIAFTFNPNDNRLINTYEWSVSDKRGIEKFNVSSNKLNVIFQAITSSRANNSNPPNNTQPSKSSEKYIGESNAKGQPHGMGIYILANGDKFEATWINGVAEGHGTYTSHEGWEYIGTIKNSQFHGIGTVYYKDGSYRTSKWNNGKHVEDIE